MKKVFTRITIGIVFLLICSNGSFAILDAEKTSKEGLIRHCERITYGKIVDIRCARSEYHGGIFTYVTVQVIDQYKGEDVGGEITLEIPGGTLDGLALEVEDTPTNLELGMEIITHLDLDENGYFWLYGWKAGVLEVDNRIITKYGIRLKEFQELIREITE